MTTLAPSAANSSAVAAPIPMAPPVIKATLPSKRPTCAHLLVWSFPADRSPSNMDS